MSENLTAEQQLALETDGKVIVSASAGSGKTFVMIKKMTKYILQEGGKMENILAMTFTTKAAEQMKDKMKKSLIEQLKLCTDPQLKAHIKEQLNLVAIADISTIHSFCSRLLRTYFYAIGIDSTFEIMTSGDPSYTRIQRQALDQTMDELYDEDSEDLKILLTCFKRSGTDNKVRDLILSSYQKVRNNADYVALLTDIPNFYNEEGFEKLCKSYQSLLGDQADRYIGAMYTYKENFPDCPSKEKYDKLFDDTIAALSEVRNTSLFNPLPAIPNKPRKTAGDEDAEAIYAQFDNFKKKYKKWHNFKDEQTEYQNFLLAGKLSSAISRVLLKFDANYTAAKKEENKLDYNDLEHYTLALLQVEDVRRQLSDKYQRVFVDEYQDVNPVQEAIIEGLNSNNIFLVGDVKQAIYAFRGSKSTFFTQKEQSYLTQGSALKLTKNFRSDNAILDFVNRIFADIITTDNFGFDYLTTGYMTCGDVYPHDSGEVQLHTFEEEEQQATLFDLYSVKEDNVLAQPPSSEGLAIGAIILKELGRPLVPSQPERKVTFSDICILTRKRTHPKVRAIVRSLRAMNIPVSWGGVENVCERPEVKQMLDILSYLDNAEQDIPLVSALLSPLGKLTENELAHIRADAKAHYSYSDLPNTFRAICHDYALRQQDDISQKLRNFYTTMQALREDSAVFNVQRLVDKILMISGLEGAYSGGNGEKLRAIRTLLANGNCMLPAFLQRVKDNNYDIPMTPLADNDCVQVMTMHVSKGLEFPIVILPDLNGTFQGDLHDDMPFDETFGFAPKFYNFETRVSGKSLLSLYTQQNAAIDDYRNEVNLFYVACTRARLRLHIIVSKRKTFDPFKCIDAKCYADLANFEWMQSDELSLCAPAYEEENDLLFTQPNEEMLNRLRAIYHQPYAHESAIHLPAKSSATQLLQEQDDAPIHQLFEETEVQTNAAVGTAYHRYLELCDFEKRSLADIENQIVHFVQSGELEQEQAALLDASHLCKLLALPVFAELQNKTLYREQEFLCRLPACEFLATDTDESVLVQGAIDLLVLDDGSARIIDYKYSKRTEEGLRLHYGSQLVLYRNAVAVITKLPKEKITADIVNILTGKVVHL